MTHETYNKLREQLDQYSVGFPETKSGIELRILERMFTVDEAELFLGMSMMLEDPSVMAARTGRDLPALSQQLEQMAHKGLIFRHRQGDRLRYAAIPFVVGSYEFQLSHLDKELAKMFDTYLEEVFLDNLMGKVVPLRTIPVNRSLDVSYPVSPYEDARQIIAGKEKIAVANCICRVQKGLLGEECERPVEVCLVFGSHADYYVDNKMARRIDQREALEILDRCEKAGLVNQPFNTVNPEGMCNCCGDCCGVLRALKRLPRPIDVVVSAYYAVVDEDECSACETCADRCQMDAIRIGSDGVSIVTRDRCIGCGLCVTTCPTGALRLVRLPDGETRSPARNGMELMMKMAQARGTSIVPRSFSKS